MRSLQALVLLGLTLGCVAHAVVLSQARLPDCDSDEAEQAATVALYHINHNAVHGYKHALNQIDNIRVLPRRPFGELILLELKLVETECHVVSPVPAENCTVRALQSHAVEADCDVRMLRVQDDYKVTAVKCHSSPDSVEDLAKICPDCPVLAPLSNPDIVATAEKALADFNAGNAPVFYKLLEISRGMFVPMPHSIYTEFAIAATNCTFEQGLAHQDCYVQTGKDSSFGFCKATIYQKGKGSAPLDENDMVQCDIFEHEDTAFQAHQQDHHLKENMPSPGIGRTVLDLAHSHNDTWASHESHSAEILPAAPVVKRAVQAEVQGKIKLQVCPGRLRHFHV
ncbi:alpha-2-HS-glycoprotein [Varanus komodoensis]|uniref:alpha-2-HS-glycoprotein n=1 Tax=Varanus komodoensis TaxID=61221 RepID=UPI001CF77B38|nr:alpha-2-HS-glycoprotein [Varanus komodoensis]